MQIDPNFPFFMTEKEDGSWTFAWDENHPVTSVFNNWTEKDFLDMLINAARETIAKYEVMQ